MSTLQFESTEGAVKILGLDCATACGYFLVERTDGRERALAHGVLDMSFSAADRVGTFAARICSDKSRRPDLVVIEDPYLDKNVLTLKVLARLTGRLQQAFEERGVAVELLAATEWQREILGRFGGKKREGLKKAALLWSRAMFGVKLTSDEADAAGLAVCALRRHSFKARCAR